MNVTAQAILAIVAAGGETGYRLSVEVGVVGRDDSGVVPRGAKKGTFSFSINENVPFSVRAEIGSELLIRV